MLTLILAVFIGCFFLERVFPGWPLPRVRTWPLRVVLVNLIQLAVVMLAGLTWEKWLASWSVFELSAHVPPCDVAVVVLVALVLMMNTMHLRPLKEKAYPSRGLYIGMIKKLTEGGERCINRTRFQRQAKECVHDQATQN